MRTSDAVILPMRNLAHMTREMGRNPRSMNVMVETPRRIQAHHGKHLDHFNRCSTKPPRNEKAMDISIDYRIGPSGTSASP